jgi:Crp-like helix-turn-helix domain
VKQYILKISQESLGEMIGTTRSRVSFFMNRFRKLGFIEYSSRVKVHKSPSSVLLELSADRPPKFGHRANSIESRKAHVRN